MQTKRGVLLGVNIDHVATLRQARRTRYPDPVQAALEAEQAGADIITMHLREDRRHIQERDVKIVQEVLLTRLNLEMAMTEEMLDFATSIKPQDCCLVPERREELTTEGGLEIAGQLSRVKGACTRLKEAGIRVSLFIDPEDSQLEAAAQAGALVVELHTGHYAEAPDRKSQEEELQRLVHSVHRGRTLGLQVNAGHGLNYQNVGGVASLEGVKELNIGHAIVARALFCGWDSAVREMKQLLR